jgi:glucose-1-phosphate cytidylyltransferase
MKTIILCGGQGTRMKEETEFKPKPLVEIGGKPILWHIMKIYSYYGYNEFILALGYKGNMIKEYFLHWRTFLNDFTLTTKNNEITFHNNDCDDFKITFVDTGTETLPGERILRCQKYIPKEDPEFMVTYGDGVIDLNINDLLDFHRKQKTIGTITGIHPRFKFGTAVVNSDNLVKNFSEKPILDDWVNGGFMVFKKKVFSYLRHGETEHPALRRLSKEKKLSLFKHNGSWACMDTHKEHEELNKYWAEDPFWKIWDN